MHTTREQLVKFIFERLDDLSLTPRSVSLSLGKSQTYLADFLGKKASPKVIDEDTRADLARILQTDSGNLRYQRSIVKDSVTNSGKNVRTTDIVRSGIRKDSGMNLRDVYIRIGKLELRIEQLEADRSAQNGSKGKPRTRPT